MKRKRNRIVINLDHGAGGPVRKRRGGLGRVLLIVGVVLLLLVGGLAAGGYFWWRNFQGTPAYTLAVLADASQRKDTATCDLILNSEKITDDFVAQVRQRLTGSLVDSLWPSQAASTLSVTPKLRETVHDEIIKELERLTAPAKGKPLILIALAMGRFAEIKQENNLAKAQVNISGEQLGLTMQPEGNRWRVIAVQDDKLAKEIADGVMRDLPARGGAQLNEEIRKQLEKVKPK